MKIDSGLTNYDEQTTSNDQKRIYKLAIIVLVLLLGISGVLTVFFNHIYSLIIGIFIGGIGSITLFYITTKLINTSHYLDLKKTTKKIHIIHQLTYVLSLLICFLIFYNPFVIIGLVAGFLIIKVAIIIHNALEK